MAVTKKILGQSFPSATTLTDAYTVPGSTSATVSTITACNHSDTASDNIRISVSIAGAANTDAQYIIGGDTSGGLFMSANDSYMATIGMTLATTDVVRVYSENGTTSFNVFGAEET